MNIPILRRFTVAGIGAVTGFAAIALSAAPAHADFEPAMAAYVWAFNPSAPSYTVPITGTYGGVNDYYYAANSGNGPITITRSSAGTYRVRFGGLGALVTGGGGVVNAEAYGPTSNMCTIDSWYSSGADLLVSVNCFSSTGVRQDTAFVASFVEASGSSADSGVSYLFASQPTTASYVPSAWYRFDATGGTASITRVGMGSYHVYLPASAGQTELTFYQVSAFSTTAVSCKVADYVGAGVAYVTCRNAGGTLVDARFTITWTIYNLLQRIAPTALAAVHNTYPTDTTPTITWTNDSSVSGDYAVTRMRAGVYEMFFPQIYDDSGHAVVHANGDQSARCSVAGWSTSGTTDIKVSVNCVNPSGTPVDTPFVVGFTW